MTGTKQYRVGGKVLDKWLRGFTLRFLPRERWLANSSGARQNMLRVRGWCGTFGVKNHFESRGWCGTFGVSKQIREERFVLNIRSEQNIKRYDLL